MIDLRTIRNMRRTKLKSIAFAKAISNRSLIAFFSNSCRRLFLHSALQNFIPDTLHVATDDELEEEEEELRSGLRQWKHTRERKSLVGDTA